MNWLAISEVVTGLVLRGEIDIATVDPNLIHPACLPIIKRLKDGIDKLHVRADVGALANQVEAAARRYIGDTDTDFLEWLRLAYERHQAGEAFQNAAKNLLDGKDTELSVLRKHIETLTRIDRLIVKASEVQAEESHFVPSCWEPIDSEIGGVPRSGLILIGALPKVGKTSLMCLLATLASRRGMSSIFFTFEMRVEELVQRFRDVGAESDDLERILLVDKIMDIDGVSSLVMAALQRYNLRYVFIDFADFLIRDMITEESTTRVYAGGAALAKMAGIPVYLACQFNSGAYQGGLPSIRDIRYSRMSAAFCSQAWLLHNPSLVWAGKSTDTRLPEVSGSAYVIVAISRHGFGRHETAGAIRVSWAPKEGWGMKSEGWFDLGLGYV